MFSICALGGMVTNMKILVFSDSHGRLGHMMDAMERERPRRVFFLGDCHRDGEALRNAYPDVPMELVRGNCDWDQAPDELLVEAGGVRFLLTHGHRYYVKSGPDHLARSARAKGAGVVCFGHTHDALNMPNCGVWMLNPGTAGGIHARAGYGVIEVENGKFRTELR